MQSYPLTNNPKIPLIVLDRNICTHRKVMHLGRLLDVDLHRAAGLLLTVWLRHAWSCQIRSRDGAWVMLNGQRSDIDRAYETAPHADVSGALIAAGLLEVEPDGLVFQEYGNLFVFVSERAKEVA